MFRLKLVGSFVGTSSAQLLVLQAGVFGADHCCVFRPLRCVVASPWLVIFVLLSVVGLVRGVVFVCGLRFSFRLLPNWLDKAPVRWLSLIYLVMFRPGVVGAQPGSSFRSDNVLSLVVRGVFVRWSSLCCCPLVLCVVSSLCVVPPSLLGLCRDCWKCVCATWPLRQVVVHPCSSASVRRVGRAPVLLFPF